MEPIGGIFFLSEDEVHTHVKFPTSTKVSNLTYDAPLKVLAMTMRIAEGWSGGREAHRKPNTLLCCAKGQRNENVSSVGTALLEHNSNGGCFVSALGKATIHLRRM